MAIDPTIVDRGKRALKELQFSPQWKFFAAYFSELSRETDSMAVMANDHVDLHRGRARAYREVNDLLTKPVKE